MPKVRLSFFGGTICTYIFSWSSRRGTYLGIVLFCYQTKLFYGCKIERGYYITSSYELKTDMTAWFNYERLKLCISLIHLLYYAHKLVNSSLCGWGIRVFIYIPSLSITCTCLSFVLLYFPFNLFLPLTAILSYTIPETSKYINNIQLE